MTANDRSVPMASAATGHDPNLFAPVPDQHIRLLGHADLHFTTAVPVTAAARRMALGGSVLYIITGWLDRPGNYLTGYVGQTHLFTGARPARSWTHWVRTTGRIIPFGLGLLRMPEPIDRNMLFYIEARVIQQLCGWPRDISLLNTHTSAQISAARLSRAQVLHAQDLADQVARHTWTVLYRGRNNPWPAPAPNNREASTRIVQRASRALDVDEIVEQLLATGHTTTGQTLAFSIRRDLEQREPSRGRPRIVSAWHARRRRRIWWNPDTITKRDAIAGYDHAHPAPRRRPGGTVRTHPVANINTTKPPTAA